VKKKGWRKAGLVSLVLLVLGLALLWPQLKPAQALMPILPEGAAETDELLMPLAEEIVHRDEASGSFTRLNQLIEKARTLYPELSDEALAGFIARYTGQPELTVDAGGALFLLDYDNITTEKRLYEEGYSLTISYSNTGNDGHNQGYDLWATAAWFAHPVRGKEMTLRLQSKTAIYNNHVRAKGAVLQQFSCKKCGEVTNTCRSISMGHADDEKEGVEFSGWNGRPGIRFSFLKPACQSCGSRRGEETFCAAWSSYGVILDGMTSVGNCNALLDEQPTRALLLQPAKE